MGDVKEYIYANTNLLVFEYPNYCHVMLYNIITAKTYVYKFTLTDLTKIYPQMESSQSNFCWLFVWFNSSYAIIT